MLCELLNVSSVEANKVIIDNWNDQTVPYHTSADILADMVYSISGGQVISVRNEENKTVSVSVLVNSNQLVRYGNLKIANVLEYETVSIGTSIGEADKYVKFEYCTKSQDNSKWPVRFPKYQFFKQNPNLLIEGKIFLVDYDSMKYVAGDMYDVTDDSPATGEYLKEISNNGR